MLRHSIFFKRSEWSCWVELREQYKGFQWTIQEVLDRAIGMETSTWRFTDFYLYLFNWTAQRCPGSLLSYSCHLSELIIRLWFLRFPSHIVNICASQNLRIWIEFLIFCFKSYFYQKMFNFANFAKQYFTKTVRESKQIFSFSFTISWTILIRY